jgi:hypothetical protein
VARRTTLTLEEDVMDRLQAEARRTRHSFKDVVNDAIRSGLDRRTGERPAPYRVQARDLGLRSGNQLDDISALLEQVEGSQHR